MQPTIVTFLAFGLLIGVLGRMSVPEGGPNGWLLWMLSILVGDGGALSGAYLGRIQGLYRETETFGIAMSLATAVAFVALYEVTIARKTRLA